jgi:hypothetical protein
LKIRAGFLECRDPGLSFGRYVLLGKARDELYVFRNLTEQTEALVEKTSG